MSRTFRNKNVLPKGWSRRDGGSTYFEGNDKNGDLHESLFPNSSYEEIGTLAFKSLPSPASVWCFHWRKENKSNRYAHFRAYRAKVKNLMVHDRFDEILNYRKTSGWLTW